MGVEYLLSSPNSSKALIRKLSARVARMPVEHQAGKLLKIHFLFPELGGREEGKIKGERTKIQRLPPELCPERFVELKGEREVNCRLVLFCRREPFWSWVVWPCSGSRGGVGLELLFGSLPSPEIL